MKFGLATLLLGYTPAPPSLAIYERIVSQITELASILSVPSDLSWWHKMRIHLGTLILRYALSMAVTFIVAPPWFSQRTILWAAALQRFLYSSENSNGLDSP